MTMSHKPGMLQQVLDRVETRSPYLVAVFGIAFSFIVFESFIQHGPFRKRLRSLFTENKKLSEDQVRSCMAQAVTNVSGFVHVLIVVPLSIWVMSRPHMLKDRLHATCPESSFMLALSSGYFLYDLIICILRFDEWGISYLIHASCCALIYAYGLSEQVLHFYGAMFLTWELSTPFVYLRWLLYKMGKVNTTAYTVVGVLLTLVFFLCRTVAGTIFSIDFWRTTGKELQYTSSGALSPDVIWFYRAICIALNGLNAFWLLKLVQGGLKHLKPAATKKQT